MFYYIYILFNAESKRFYIGLTKDLKRRIREHKKSKLSHRNENYDLVLAEAYINEKDAQSREKYFKSSKGKYALRAMLRNTINNSGR